MKKAVKIGGQRAIKTLNVEINDKTYSIPLAGSMKRKDLLALKDEDAVYDMFARYIPAEVLDDLTLDEYSQLCEAWTETNKETEGAELGES